MANVLIDTGAFVALMSRRDNLHEVASDTYDSLVAEGTRFFTTNHLVDETCTRLLRHAHGGHRAALKFGEKIKEAAVVVGARDAIPGMPGFGQLLVVYSTPDVEQRAWHIFAKYDTAGFSFTDCVSFAVMQTMGIKKAFTFDTHFDVMGFERV